MNRAEIVQGMARNRAVKAGLATAVLFGSVVGGGAVWNAMEKAAKAKSNRGNSEITVAFKPLGPNDLAELGRKPQPSVQPTVEDLTRQSTRSAIAVSAASSISTVVSVDLPHYGPSDFDRQDVGNPTPRDSGNHETYLNYNVPECQVLNSAAQFDAKERARINDIANWINQVVFNTKTAEAASLQAPETTQEFLACMVAVEKVRPFLTQEGFNVDAWTADNVIGLKSIAEWRVTLRDQLANRGFDVSQEQIDSFLGSNIEAVFRTKSGSVATFTAVVIDDPAEFARRKGESGVYSSGERVWQVVVGDNLLTIFQACNNAVVPIFPLKPKAVSTPTATASPTPSETPPPTNTAPATTGEKTPPPAPVNTATVPPSEEKTNTPVPTSLVASATPTTPAETPKPTIVPQTPIPTSTEGTSPTETAVATATNIPAETPKPTNTAKPESTIVPQTPIASSTPGAAPTEAAKNTATSIPIVPTEAAPTAASTTVPTVKPTIPPAAPTAGAVPTEAPKPTAAPEPTKAPTAVQTPVTVATPIPVVSTEAPTTAPAKSEPTKAPTTGPRPTMVPGGR